MSASLRAATATPGSAPPCSSVTYPRRLPAPICAAADTAVKSISAKDRIKLLRTIVTSQEKRGTRRLVQWRDERSALYTMACDITTLGEGGLWYTCRTTPVF